MSKPSLIPVVVILGPTGVGKTEVSIELAERLEGEIVSADSRLFYRGMDIGTAKPTLAQRSRIRHHLIDVADPTESWSLATFRLEALKALKSIHDRRRLPFLVGGTGQYLTALLDGWVPPPRPTDASQRRALEAYAAEHGAKALHRQLAEVDAERAAQIDHRNVRRVVRALEIYHTTGLPPSQIRKREKSPLAALRIGLHLPRDELYARLDARIEGMLRVGLVEEVRAMMADGVPANAPSMSAIGYREIVRYLQEELTLEQAQQQIGRATRQLVRRQANWFKADDPRIHWFEARPGVADKILPLIQSWSEESMPSGG
ncbi:MAG: tRNA (adenosine(37)-N6)-dimethylallyltransferase MiaA [Anaerolineales bacterium]|jgi:tRNA dimethylallyltransferase